MNATGPRAGRTRLILAVATLAIIVFVFVVVQPDIETSTGEAVASNDEAQVARGEYLAIAGNCASCHTTGNEGYMAGGLAFETPFGRIYSTNITPDPTTGIGTWSALDFLNSMRHGVRPDGEHLYPAFPYTSFTKIRDEDVMALFAYLKSIPPVNSVTPENEMPFPFNQRALMGIWNAMFFEAGEYVADESRSTEWNRGAYLVNALTHCGACHSPRNMLGAENLDRAMSGGEYTDRMPSGAYRPWSAPNLTSATSALGMWPHDELKAYLKDGINSFVETFGPMNEVIMNSTRHLSDEDLGAISTYLVNLPPIDQQGAADASANVLGMGRTLYNLHCGTCHLPTGLGGAESGPRLAGGSLIVQANNPASLINVILDGPELPDPPLETERRNAMESFRYLLDDEEIAALASYLRVTWGNTGGEVTAEQVARQR